MPVIRLVTQIDAPPDRCFDLSRSIDLHVATAAGTGARAVAAVAAGRSGLGGEGPGGAKHLGAWRHLTPRSTPYARPRHFRDSQVRGAFKRFDHDHFFEEAAAA